jgi:16S rRNA (cytosine967-C5)-methyltransferase
VSTARDLALEALNRQDQNLLYPERYLERRLEREPDLDERDRAFTIQLVQGVLRWRLRLDWIIAQGVKSPKKKIDPPVLNVLRLSLYQIFFLDRVPESAAVNEAVRQARAFGRGHVSGFVNGLLRNLCRNRERIPLPEKEKNPATYLSVFHSYPLWLVRKWLREFGGEETERLLEAMNRVPRMGVRTNTLKGSRAELKERLAEEGVTGIEMPYSPEGLFLDDLKGPVHRLKAFSKGLFQVQGEAPQISSHLLNPDPGNRVLDLCAGLGGKTTHLAELMGGNGTVFALDRSHGRLLSLGETARRLGIGSIRPLTADASGPLENLFRKSFDRILVDAPCSGLGVLSRHPDGKWGKTEEDILRLSALQQEMLRRAAPLLKVGGRMLYVVCTLSREENEGVVERFLSEQAHMALENLKGDVPAWAMPLIDPHGYFRTLPHEHGMDGFFGALLVRR